MKTESEIMDRIDELIKARNGLKNPEYAQIEIITCESELATLKWILEH